MSLLLIFAFLAGLVTALSPCSLPILPVLLSATSSRLKPLAIVIGLVITFTLFILFIGTIVQSLGISPQMLRMAAIALIFIFGLVLLVPPLSDWFSRVTTPFVGLGEQLKGGSGWIGGLILGASLGLLWTPCAGPILAAIVTLAITQTVTLKLFFLALFYSLGAALPMLLIIYGGQTLLRSSRFLSSHLESIRKAFGLLLLLTSLSMASGADLALQDWASQYVPSLVLEDTVTVHEELAHLRKGEPKSLELVGITGWINSPPLTLKKLRGKVVLIDFWTYSCINCLRTLPYLKEWDEKYRDRGLVIIGVHTPEFAFEKKLENVQNAVKRFQIRYPVALDSDYKTWEAFQNSYWPAHYLFNQEGHLVQEHFGEGGYVQTENQIRALLGLSPIEKEEPKSETHLTQTPETYLGSDRASPYATGESPGPNQVVLKGGWKVGPESITATGQESILLLNFQATYVYLVMEGHGTVELLLDGKPLPKILVDEPRKYDLIDLKGEYGRHLLQLHFSPGVSAYAFTFG